MSINREISAKRILLQGLLIYLFFQVEWITFLPLIKLNVFNMSRFLAVAINFTFICFVWSYAFKYNNRWLEKNGLGKIDWSFDKKSVVWIVIGLIFAILFNVFSDLYYKTPFTPDLIREFKQYTDYYQLWGAIGFLGQLVYYYYEFLLVSTILYTFGCAVKALKSKLPWAGFLLALTWGAGHFISKDIFSGFHSILLCIFCGIMYRFNREKMLPVFLLITMCYFI